MPSGIADIPGEADLTHNPPPEFQWSYSATSVMRAHALALEGQADEAMELIESVLPALIYGAYWAHTYCVTACGAASVLWLLGRTEHADLIEKSLREKVLVPDFRYPMRDARLSMARLCALQGRHGEAEEWFGKARGGA